MEGVVALVDGLDLVMGAESLVAEVAEPLFNRVFGANVVPVPGIGAFLKPYLFSVEIPIDKGS